ncbi:glutaredoxin family protein [Candidatus Woesearchaeota archaeon]|nr:glutaredoxin family protein [Candidatus Woesearchaeota archaeon]
MMRVKVYSTKNCPGCEKVKSFLKEHKVAFQTIDISEDAQALTEMIERTGQMKVPVTEIDGELIVGAMISQIAEKLGIEGY